MKAYLISFLIFVLSVETFANSVLIEKLCSKSTKSFFSYIELFNDNTISYGHRVGDSYIFVKNGTWKSENNLLIVNFCNSSSSNPFSCSGSQIKFDSSMDLIDCK